MVRARNHAGFAHFTKVTIGHRASGKSDPDLTQGANSSTALAGICGGTPGRRRVRRAREIFSSRPPRPSCGVTVPSETATEFTSGSKTDDRRPVTPEVAGSSPVAPVKFLQIELCCCRSDGGILGNYRLFHAATRSKQTGSPAPD